MKSVVRKTGDAAGCDVECNPAFAAAPLDRNNTNEKGNAMYDDMRGANSVW